MAIRFDQIQLSDDGNHLRPTIDGDNGYLTIRTTGGKLQIGPGNSTFSHFYTDRGSYYFNTATVNFDGNIQGYGGDETISNFYSITTGIFYDKDNTNYFVDPNSVSYMNRLLLENARISSNEEWPVGHYTGGKEIWSLDPTWTDDQIQQYFGSSNVEWLEDSNAPGGWAIKITGAVNVGGLYDSGFPYIPIEEDAIYYMECYIRGSDSSTQVRHYMGSQDFTESFGSPSSGSGNPGSFGYWVMSNTATNGSSYAKVHGIIRGHHDNTTGRFETGAKYWTPQALFNYSHQAGTRACVISGWKVIKISSQEYFADGTSSVPSISFAEDKDVGLYRPGSNQLGFVVGGGQRLSMSTTNASFSVNVMPSAENSYNIGSSSLRWEDLYVDDGYIRDVYVDNYVRHNGDPDTYFGFNGQDQWKLHLGGGDRLIVTTSQFESNLGIKAPVYYDNNTAYYADLGSSSIALNINGIIDQNFEQSNLNTAWTTPGNSFAEGFIVGRYQSTASNVPSNNDNANWFMNIYSHSTGGTASYGIQLAGSNANSGENALSLRNVSNGSFGSWRKVYHEGHKPTYAELGSMAYSNLTGTPTIPSSSSFVDLSSNQTVGGNKLFTGNTTFRKGASDQNNTSDTGSIPSTTGAEMLRLEGGYTNGQYTHEIAKIDRGGNLPLYIRESKSSANSFTNLVRFGNHSNSQKEFQVFGDAQATSYYSTGSITGTIFYDTDNSGRYVDPGSTGDSTYLRGYIRSTKYKRFANTFDSELPSAMPMIGGSDSSIGRGYATVGFDTNGRLAIYERVYTIKISGSGWLNRNTNPIPIFPPSGNHFVVVEDFVVYIDYETRTGISTSGIARLNDTNAYTVGFYENAQSGNSPGSGQFYTLGVMPQQFVRNATTDQGYYRDVPVHQSKLLPNRGLFLRTARDCTSTSNAPGGTHYVQIKYRIINTSSEMESDVDYNVNYAGTTSNRTAPLHDVDGSFISY